MFNRSLFYANLRKYNFSTAKVQTAASAPAPRTAKAVAVRERPCFMYGLSALARLAMQGLVYRQELLIRASVPDVAIDRSLPETF